MLRRDLYLHGLQVEASNCETIHLSDRMSRIQWAVSNLVFVYGVIVCIGMAAAAIVLFWLTYRRWDNSLVESALWFLIGSLFVITGIHWILQLWRTVVRWLVRYSVKIDRERIHLSGRHRLSKRIHLDAVWANGDVRFEVSGEKRNLPGLRSMLMNVNDSAIDLHLRLDTDEVRDLSSRLCEMGFDVANAALHD